MIKIATLKNSRFLAVAFAVLVSAHAQDDITVKFTNALPELSSKNLVPNGSFEVGQAGWSSRGEGVDLLNEGWAPLGKGTGWGNFGKLHGEVVSDGASDGKRFLRIPLGGTKTPVFNFDYFKAVNHRELRPLAANIGWIRVQTGQPYTISCDLRASVEGVRAALGVHSQNPAGGQTGTMKDYRKQVTLGKEWKRYTYTFTSEQPYVFVTIGPDLEKEVDVTVDVDAIQLEKGDKATAFAPQAPVEIGIRTTENGGVFFYGQDAGISITANNSSDKAETVTVSFKVKDFFDQSLSLEAAKIDVPAKSSAEKIVKLPADWKGYYRIEATYPVLDKTETRIIRTAFVPKPRFSDSVMGMNHAPPTPYLVEQTMKSGVTWFRDWSFKWDHIEPEKGKFRWDLSDPQINRLTDKGAHVVTLLPPFPSANWSSEAPEDLAKYVTQDKGVGDSGELLARIRTAWAPKNPQDLVDYITAVINRYKDRVNTYEFLNEPLQGAYGYSLPPKKGYKGAPGKRYTKEDLHKLEEIAFDAMRKADPNVRILIHKNLVHDYPALEIPETALIKKIKISETPQDTPPLWFTEFAYFGTDDAPRKPFKKTPGSWSEARLLSEKECADYSIRAFLIMLAANTEKIFMHAGTTDSVNKDGTETAIFAYGGAPRKLFPAVAVFSDIVGPKPKFKGLRRFAGGGYAMAFETGENALLAIWNSVPGDKIETNTPAGAEIRNIMGQTVKADKIAITTTPQYLLGKSGESEKMLKELNLPEHKPTPLPEKTGKKGKGKGKKKKEE